ncbi:MAG: hypothetical protein ACRD0F_08205 [Acidimicrobiales bacterium]
MTRGDAPTLGMVAGPSLLGVATTMITLAWIRHNRRIYTRKGPRRAVPDSGYRYTRDRRDRVLMLDRVDLAQAAEVVVRLAPGGADRAGGAGPTAGTRSGLSEVPLNSAWRIPPW